MTSGLWLRVVLPGENHPSPKPSPSVCLASLLLPAWKGSQWLRAWMRVCKSQIRAQREWERVKGLTVWQIIKQCQRVGSLLLQQPVISRVWCEHSHVQPHDASPCFLQSPHFHMPQVTSSPKEGDWNTLESLLPEPSKWYMREQREQCCVCSLWLLKSPIRTRDLLGTRNLCSGWARSLEDWSKTLFLRVYWPLWTSLNLEKHYPTFPSPHNVLLSLCKALGPFSLTLGNALFWIKTLLITLLLMTSAMTPTSK